MQGLNIRYIGCYIVHISDIGKGRNNIGHQESIERKIEKKIVIFVIYRFLIDISVFDRYIVEVSGMWHARTLF